MKKRGYDDEGDSQPGDFNVGSMLVSERDLKQNRELPAKQFPFGFTAPRTHHVSGATNRHRDTRGRPSVR